MSCCSRSNDSTAQESVYDLLDTVALRGIAEQTHEANQVMYESFRSLEKADRAAALGYGEDVVQHHRAAGERANRICRRQFRSIIEAIDERVSRDDWGDLVASARREYETRDGRELLEDVRAELRARWLDMDTLPSRSVSTVVHLTDEAVDRVEADGLSGGIQLLRERLETALSDLAAPEMGRQPKSPDEAMFWACFGGCVAISITALIICGLSPFCWCCWAWAILIAQAVCEGSCFGFLAIG